MCELFQIHFFILLSLEGKNNDPLLRCEMNTGFLEACFVCACDSNGTDLLTLEYEHNLMAIWEGFEELSIDISPIHQLQLQLSYLWLCKKCLATVLFCPVGLIWVETSCSYNVLQCSLMNSCVLRQSCWKPVFCFLVCWGLGRGVGRRRFGLVCFVFQKWSCLLSKYGILDEKMKTDF